MQHLDFFNYFVIDGDWDVDGDSVQSDRNYLEISDLIAFGAKYKQSESFARCLSELSEGKAQKDHSGHPYTSEQSIADTFDYYLALIGDMRVNGYVQRKDLTHSKLDTDIGVAVARDGSLLHFRRGHHRLAIAKQIGLTSVAVQVQLVHAEWVLNQIEAYNCEEMLAINFGLRGLADKHNV